MALTMRKCMKYAVFVFMIIFLLDGEAIWDTYYGVFLNNGNNIFKPFNGLNQNTYTNDIIYNSNNKLFYVKASPDEEFDPSDYFGQHSMDDDDLNMYGDEEDDSSDNRGGAFSLLPVTVQDGIQYAYSSVRIRDQVSFFILPKSGVPVERRYNNYKYVYKQHILPLNEVATALTPVLSMSSVLATTTKGNLYLRHAKDPGGAQIWTNVTWGGHKIIGGGQFFNAGPSKNKQHAYFVSATGSLLEFNILSIVVQRDDGNHIFTSPKDFAKSKNWKNLGAPSDGGLIAVVGVFYRAENRKVIACVNAMGKLVFNENNRWKELSHPPQYNMSHITVEYEDSNVGAHGKKKTKTHNNNNINKKSNGKKGKSKKKENVDKDVSRGYSSKTKVVTDMPDMKFLSMPTATLTDRAHENAPTILFSLSTNGILYGVVQKKKGGWVFEDHACIVHEKTGTSSTYSDNEDGDDDEDDDSDMDENADMDDDDDEDKATDVNGDDDDSHKQQQQKLIRFVSAPSKAVLRNSDLSIFIVSDEGKLYERTMTLNKKGAWKWVLHNHPHGHRLSPAAPLVSHAGEIVCRTRKGLFAVLHLWGYVWKWQIENPPEAFMLNAPALVTTGQLDGGNAGASNNEDNAKHESASGNSESVHEFCAPHDLLDENHCDFGMDPMTLIPKMKLQDAYQVVEEAPPADDGSSRFGVREEVNPKTKLKINVDAPPISYTVDPFDENSQSYYNCNWGNCMVPAIALIIRTVNMFSPEKVFKPWSQLIKETTFKNTQIGEPAVLNEKFSKKACLKMRIKNITSLLLHGGLNMKSSRQDSAGARASFGLASMAENSVFIVSPGGYVFERFWNQANWVYVRHGGLPNSPVIQVSTIKQGGTLFASTADGTLFQRVARGFSSPLVWKALPYRSSRFFHGGITSGNDRNRVYFIDHGGKIIVRLVKQHKWEVAIPNANNVVWTKDETHRSYSLPVKEQDVLMKGVTIRRGGKMVDIAVIISWEELHNGLSFFLDTNGELWEYSSWLHRYTWHGAPDRDTKLSLHPAAVLPDSTAVGSLFFRTVDGRVVERYFNQFSGKWMWVDHHHPPIAKIASAPGAVLFNNRIHFVGVDGHLWALVFRVDEENGDGWTWIDSGIPGIPLALMRPVNIGRRGVGALTINGKFAERVLNPATNVWIWDMAEIPEGSSIGAPPGTSYCSHEVLSPMNCVRGNKGIQTIDLTNPTSKMYRELQAFAGEVDSQGDFVLKGRNGNDLAGNGANSEDKSLLVNEGLIMKGKNAPGSKNTNKDSTWDAWFRM